MDDSIGILRQMLAGHAKNAELAEATGSNEATWHRNRCRALQAAITSLESTGQTSDARDANAERYKWLRSALYSDAVAVGEASIRLDVVGACPTLAAFDEAIDAAMLEAGK